MWVIIHISIHMASACQFPFMLLFLCSDNLYGLCLLGISVLFVICYLEWEKRGGKEVSFGIVGFPVMCMNNVNKVKPTHKLSCKASLSSLF